MEREHGWFHNRKREVDQAVVYEIDWTAAYELARLDFGPIGALMGYDFHVTQSRPRLIEVNTNAGGAFLNAALARAQRAFDMFIDEWRRQRGSGRPSVQGSLSGKQSYSKSLG